MSGSRADALSELIGVYHADGGPIGEARYVLGKLFGTTHCSLCDITHSGVRRRREWDAMVTAVGLPFRLVHLNEMPADVRVAVATVGSPVVLARGADGSLAPLLTAAELDPLSGSVDGFQAAVRGALDRMARPAG